MTEEEYAEATFNEVADKYDEIPFFKISAQYLTQIVKKEKTENDIEVLDVACGTGNVTLTCAQEMPTSSFTGIDISEGMLTKARSNADTFALENVTFHCQDVSSLNTTAKYVVITCAYALFFLPNAHTILSNLVDSLRDEGRVIFTSFLPKAFAPSVDILIPLLKEEGSTSAQEYDANRWENLKEIADIERLCEMVGVKNYNISMKVIRYDMHVDAWWELMNNTGFKGMLMELSSQGYARVKKAYYDGMLKHADTDGEVELNADSYYVSIKV